MTNRVELIDNVGGDYSVLIVDDEVFYEGSSIPDFAWVDLLKTLNVRVFQKTVSDKDMEAGFY